MLRDVPMDEPVYGDWTPRPDLSEAEQRRILDIRRAFYALCMHIDHQIRVVLGTLKATGELGNTVILFSPIMGLLYRYPGKRVGTSRGGEESEIF